jgi:mRNA-degrading endonuclease toxin of MazEF toxin-antitoxin module
VPCYQIRTPDKRRSGRMFGTHDEALRRAIIDALTFQLDMT